MSKALGKLERVGLGSQWPKEEPNLTPWLASEDGLRLLSEELKMDLVVEGTEVPVGPFSADIVAKDVSSDSRVVIENQYGKTDHDHLGKAITYASGLEAKVIVWIAETFTDEHRRALDYLNETAVPDLLFFGLEMELWKIGDSLPAPYFKVVSSPNDFLGAVKREKSLLAGGDPLYQEFWTAFKDYCQEDQSTLRLVKPRPQSWMFLSIGRAGFHIALTASKQKGNVGCELFIDGAANAKKAFEKLESHKQAIEAITGPLEWQKLPTRGGCRIAMPKIDVDLENDAAWKPAFTQLRRDAEKLFEALRDPIRSLDLETEGPDKS